MRKHKRALSPLFLTKLTCAMLLGSSLSHADLVEQEPETQSESPSSPENEPSTGLLRTKAITPFTGKVVRNKVRLRTQPNLDAPIIKELDRDDMIVIDGENDDFYAVTPPADFKAYVYRTYILDGVIEGNRVNVRLEPDLEAPVLTQLKTGDRVQAEVSPLNSKWAEIPAPESVRFYVAKDYVEKIGDAHLLGQIQKRREEVNRLLNNAYLSVQSEMQKTFQEIRYDSLVANFNNIIQNYSDYPEQSGKAKELLSNLKNDYIKRKLEFLEAKTQVLENSNALSTTVRDHKDHFVTVSPAIHADPTSGKIAFNDNDTPSNSQFREVQKPATEPFSSHVETDLLTAKMSQWIPVEKSRFDEWQQENPGKSLEQYYQEQYEGAIELKGILEAYNRPVRNKPGDYLLMNLSNKLPSAYLYSTHVDLQNLIGHEVTIKVASRPNNYFAFPAYYVLEVK